MKIKRLINNLSNKSYSNALYSNFFGYGLNFFIQVFAFPFYINEYGLSGFGFINIILSIANFGTIGISWSSSLLLRSFGLSIENKDKETFKESYYLSKVIFLLYGIILVLFAFIYSIIIDNNFIANTSGSSAFDAKFSIIIYSFSFLFLYASNKDRLLLTSNKMQSYVNIITGLTPVFTFLIWFFLNRFNNNISSLALSNLITNIFFYFYCRKIIIRKKLICRINYFKRFLTSPLPEKSFFFKFKDIGIGYFFNGISLIVLQSDILLVGILGGTKEVTLYVIAWKIPFIIYNFISKFPESSAPYIISYDAKNNITKIKKFSRNLFKITSFISISAFSSYMIFGKFIIDNWINNKEVEITLLAIISSSIAALFLSIIRLPNVILSARAKLKFLNNTAILEIVIRIFISLIFFKYFGISSFFIAIIISHIIWVIPRYLSYKKEWI
mgnify:CR=1 FL=1